MHKSFFVLFFWFFCQCVGAQKYLPQVTHFGLEEGLPHREVFCVMEDKKGFIWSATRGGVARFDGRKFKIFNKANTDLQTDQVHGLLEDANGMLWLISRRDLYSDFGVASIDILDPMTRKVMSLESYTGKLPVPLSTLNNRGVVYHSDSLNDADNGTIYFGTHKPGGWVSWHPKKGWKQVKAPHLDLLNILSVTPEKGVMGLAVNLYSAHVLVELDVQGRELKRHVASSGNKFNKLLGGDKDRRHIFVLEYNNKKKTRYCWDISSGKEKELMVLPSMAFKDDKQNHFLIELEKNKLWVNERSLFNDKGEVLFDWGVLMTGVNVYFEDFLCDSHGGVWLAGPYGLHLIEARKDLFRRYLHNENQAYGLNIPCRGLVKQNNQLWVNYEMPNCILKGIDIENGNTFFENKSGNSFGLYFNETDYEIWTEKINSTNGVIQRINPNTKKVLQTWNINKDLSWSLRLLDSAHLWIGQSKGVFVLNTFTGEFVPLQSKGFPEFAYATTVFIGIDKDKYIWLCTDKGFYKANRDGQVIERYWSNGTGRFEVPGERYYHFYQDGAGIFWLATEGAGLVKWDPKKGTKQAFSRNEGLLNSNIYAVYPDDFGCFWLPTDFGLAQFDVEREMVRHTWLPADGIAHYEFNRTSHFKDEAGNLYFGGMNGITAFHPKDFYGNLARLGVRQKANALVISDFLVLSASSRKPINKTAELIETNKITIEPEDSYIQLEFALLDYFSPKKVIYAYKIISINEDWIVLDEPTLRLSSLPSGTYQLKIKAVSADGTPAANELSYSIKVRPPIYLRWWFLLLSAVLISASIYYWNRAQFSRLNAEKEAQRLQQLDNMKTKFFTNISHEFRTPLTVIMGMIGQVNDYFRKEGVPEMALVAGSIKRNSQQLLQLINQILDLAKVEVGNIHENIQNGELISFVQFQIETVRTYAQTRNILMTFTTVVPKIEMAFDHDKLHTIITNLLSNALKFTKDNGEIACSVGLQASPDSAYEQQVIIKVKDSGLGIPKHEIEQIFDRFYQVTSAQSKHVGGSGIGLAIVKEWIKLMKGSIEVESTEGEGTQFTIRLPLLSQSPDFENYSAQSIDELQSPQEWLNLQEDQSQKPILLIVEDNPDVQMLLSNITREKYQILTARNGLQGLTLATDTIPDIIISDVMMPEMDGFELCNALKNNELTNHIPIVLLTARADFKSRITGLQHGADDYLSKPFEPTELLIRLENLVQVRKKMQAKYGLQPYFENTVPTEPQEKVDPFLQQVQAIIEANLSMLDFDIPQLEQALGMSRSQVFRKIKAITGESTISLIRNTRLQKGKELLANTQLSISEVAYSVGFSAPTYFAKSFTDAYGISPSDYRKSI